MAHYLTNLQLLITIISHYYNLREQLETAPDIMLTLVNKKQLPFSIARERIPTGNCGVAP